MENVYEKPTISISIFNESGLLGYQDTRWYFDKIMELGINFRQISDTTEIMDCPTDFELYNSSLPLLEITIYRGRGIINCWGDIYDVLKMIIFFDSLIPSEIEVYFSTFDGLVQEEEFKYRRGQSILEFASVIDKEYEGTYKLVLEEELKKYE